MLNRVPSRKVLAVGLMLMIMFSIFGVIVIFESQNVVGAEPFGSSNEISYDLGTEEQINADIASDDAGNLYVVWQEMVDDWDIYFTNSSDGGLSWRSPPIMANGSTGDQIEPSIAVNPNSGAIYVAFTDDRGGDRNISFVSSMDGGDTWSPLVQINDDNGVTTQSTPDIFVDSAGTIHAVWEDSRILTPDIYYSKSQDNGVSWLPNKIVSDAANTQSKPSIAVASGGNIYVAWQDDRTLPFMFDIYCANSTNGGLNFGTDNKVSADLPGQQENNPSIVVDGSILYAVWQDASGMGFDIFSSKSSDGGYSWSSHVVVNDDTENAQTSPEIIHAGGMLHVVWDDARDPPGDPDIYYANSTDGGDGWGPNVRVDDDSDNGYDDQKNPAIAFIPPFSVNVVWEDNRWEDNDIFFANIPTAVTINQVDRIFISRSPDGSSDWVADGIYDITGKDTFYAIGWNDTLSVFVRQVNVNWQVFGDIGYLSQSSGTSTIFTANNTGMGYIRATEISPPNRVNVTGTLTVETGGVDRIFISLLQNPTGISDWIGDQEFAKSTTRTFYAIGWNDTNDEFVKLVDSVWTSDTPSVGSVTSPGTSTTFTAEGDGICKVTVQSPFGDNETGILTVTTLEIDRIFISRSPTGSTGDVDDGTYPVGGTDTFYAIGWNDTSNIFVRQVDANWSSDAPLVGNVETPGKSTTFTALSSGTCTINASTGSYGSHETGILTVFELQIDQILISRSSDGSSGSIDSGTYGVSDTDMFYATGWNSTDNEFLGLVDATWTISDDTVATIDNSGHWINFTALEVENDSTCFVTASFSGLEDSTGTLNVLAPKLDYIQIRNFPEGAGEVLGNVTFLVDEEDTYFSAGYNRTVGYLGPVEDAQWSISGGIGNLTPTTGNLTRFLATNSGTGILTVSKGGITNQSGTITVDVNPDPPPGQPSQPTLEVKGEDEIRITWTENTEADLKEYIVQRATNASGPWTNVATIDAGTEIYTDSNLQPGTTYYYRIIAVDNAGNPSEPSPTVSATTKKATDGDDGGFPIIILILIIIVIVIVILLLLIMIKKKSET